MNDSSLSDKLYILLQFIRHRWFLNFRSKAQLQRWQAKQFARFKKKALLKSAYFLPFLDKELSSFPLMEKSTMMDNFECFNTHNINLQDAMTLATQAELSRDFSAELNGVTVGLSSGTSGTRGVFLVSKEERLRWAGILLAKTLPGRLLKHILMPWRPPLRIAFFLRANSNLYHTLNGRRIAFSFYDLLRPLDTAIESLNRTSPHILVAPATVLSRLATLQLNGQLRINPLHVVSVAEVLEETEAHLIQQAFQQKVHQIYQATEGFIGYSCRNGHLHLNDDLLHIEKNWIDKERTRFQPIITDFSRHTQLIVRYQLNDILRIASTPCSCGNPQTRIDAIEGRADEILWLKDSVSGEKIALYPDIVRRAMLVVAADIMEYRIIQQGWQWNIFFNTSGDRKNAEVAIRHAINTLCISQHVQLPLLMFDEWRAPAIGAKRRRLICESMPAESLCES